MDTGAWEALFLSGAHRGTLYLVSGSNVDPRLVAFVLGELRGATLEAFKAQLEVDAALRSQVEQLLSGPTDATLHATTAAGPPADSAQTHPTTPAPLHDRQLTVGPVLGRGGMAVVLEGRQTHLGREVAVKMALPGTPEWAREKLLQEARITGFLEHPGIVPVHDLSTDERGELQVVLKRLEGDPWSEWMLRPAEVRSRFELDPLEWHVSVTISLCRAVQFAHERGVLHRDIKPANVMIGRFGEVTLLDWGIAGTWVRDPAGLLPCIHDVPFAGTLNAMAPEQVRANAADLSPATDLYLLGACLYQAMTGQAPHANATLEDRRAFPDRPPPFPVDPSVPNELLAIVRQALEADPARRFASADALRKALEGFLKHRDGRRLAERAANAAKEARAAWAAGSRAEGEHAAAEAEFGYRAALALWPGDADAETQRAHLAAERVRFALEHGQTQAASWLLGTLEAPPPTLVLKVDEAVRVEENERERLARIEQDGDRRFGLRARRWMLAGFGLSWLLFWGAVAVAPPLTVRPLVLFLVSFTVAGTALVLPQRKTMLGHRLNREMLLVYLAMLLTSIAMGAVAWVWSLPVAAALVLLMLVWAMGMGALAVIIEPASLVPAFVWLATALVAARWPETIGVCLAVGTVTHVVWPLLVSLNLTRRSVG